MDGHDRSLNAAFLGTWRGASSRDASTGGDAALAAALARFVAEGRAAWPDVALEPATLAACLGERAPADVAPEAWLAELRASDLYLACACGSGDARAVRAFDGAFLGKLAAYLRALAPTRELVDETRQVLLERLFVGTSEKPPKIHEYSGRGALEGWLRVTAARTALNLLARQQAAAGHGDDNAALASALVPDDDPDVALMRARYRDQFVTALRDAIAGLSRRDRGLLRFTFIERLVPAQIAVAYGVHRTTVMRWIEAAQAQVLGEVRASMISRLGLSPTECDSVVAIVKSRLDLTLGSLFESRA